MKGQVNPHKCKSSLIDPNCKGRLASVCHQNFALNGWTTGTSITHFAQSVATYIEGEGATLDVPVSEGSHEDG